MLNRRHIESSSLHSQLLWFPVRRFKIIDVTSSAARMIYFWRAAKESQLFNGVCSPEPVTFYVQSNKSTVGFNWINSIVDKTCQFRQSVRNKNEKQQYEWTKQCQIDESGRLVINFWLSNDFRYAETRKKKSTTCTQIEWHSKQKRPSARRTRIAGADTHHGNKST